jgi:hyperpolarization activated cyclic nucleotide-gated potassium channel 2
VQNDSYVFSPDGTEKLLWDLLCMILIFYEIMSIPFKLSFDVNLNDGWETFVDVVFLTDIVVSFNTAFYSNGIPVI